MRAYERLLNYVVVHTASDEFSETTPTTQRQFDLANMLVPEMKALGIEDARVSDLCCVYGTLPATLGYEDAPAIGLIAHLDTVPDFCGEHVKPRIIENYDGGDVVLGDSGRTLSPAQFPHLPSLKGRTLIVTDGTTVLGADDKAGIAEIMTVVEHLIKEEAVKLYETKESEFPEAEQLRELERVVLLKSIDSKWMDHIDDMEILRQGIGLVGYGQRDPVVEYKMSAFEMFNNMISSIQEDTVRMLYHVHVEQKIEREQVAKVTGTNKDDTSVKKPVQRKEDKVYPNDPCPCGSGKKYKQCCGRKLMKA